MLALALGIGSAKAQVVAGLDEMALLGDWEISGNMGLIPSLGGNRPKTISFKDGANTTILYREADAAPRYTTFAGYWIGGTATGKYTLHLLSRFDYDSNYTGLSMVNFIITNFKGDEMTLTTYDGNCWLELRKGNSGIDDVSTDAPDAPNALYNLNGVKIENPTTPGVYIRGNGEKFIQK